MFWKQDHVQWSHDTPWSMTKMANMPLFIHSKTHFPYHNSQISGLLNSIATHWVSASHAAWHCACVIPLNIVKSLFEVPLLFGFPSLSFILQYPRGSIGFHSAVKKSKKTHTHTHTYNGEITFRGTCHEHHWIARPSMMFYTWIQNRSVCCDIPSTTLYLYKLTRELLHVAQLCYKCAQKIFLVGNSQHSCPVAWPASAHTSSMAPGNLLPGIASMLLLF